MPESIMKSADGYLYNGVLNYIYIFEWADASIIRGRFVQTGTEKLPITIYLSGFPCLLNILPVF
jgi:hypothetical protein